MNEERFKETIKNAEDRIKDYKETIGIAERLFAGGFDLSSIRALNIYYNLEIKLDNFKSLSIVRKELRRILGRWEDRCVSILAYSKNTAYVKYFSTIDRFPYERITIEIECKWEDLPKSITKNGKCHFKKSTSTDYNFVCEK